jgi:hypothetical protein
MSPTIPEYVAFFHRRRKAGGAGNERSSSAHRVRPIFSAVRHALHSWRGRAALFIDVPKFPCA